MSLKKGRNRWKSDFCWCGCTIGDGRDLPVKNAVLMEMLTWKMMRESGPALMLNVDMQEVKDGSKMQWRSLSYW
jgi:hypothetical protein